MTKTELALLAELRERPRVCVMYGYRTGTKVRMYGTRRHEAAMKLRDKGLVRVVASDHHVDCRNAYSDHWTETVIELVK